MIAITSYAATSLVQPLQPSGIDSEKSRESRSCNFRTDSYKFQKDCACSKVPCSIFPQNVSKMEENRKKPQNQPKLRESCAPWQKMRACTKTRKLRKNCAPQHHNFLGGTRQIQQYTSATDVIIFVQCHLSYAVAEWQWCMYHCTLQLIEMELRTSVPHSPLFAQISSFQILHCYCTK